MLWIRHLPKLLVCLCVYREVYYKSKTMERYNNWQDRYDDRRRDERRSDESHYRGAYRLDEEGDDSTYNRSRQGSQSRGNHGRSSDMQNRNRYNDNDNQGGDYVYRRSRNMQDNDDYTERQHQRSYRGQDDFGGRYGGSAGMRDSRSNDDERRGNSRSGSQQYDDVYRHRTSGNFDGDYRPDNYPHRRGENYGNMAGSLSFGYDGDRNSDPDYNRRYNPLTGELRQPRRDEDGRQRQPRRYGPPDRTGSNPDYDRY
jgi:hypothetical protein